MTSSDPTMGTESRNVSIVIPILNEVKNLPKLLEEIDSLIEMNGKLKAINEILIVDDGSTDGTLDFISAFSDRPHNYQIRLIRRPKKSGTMRAEICGSKKPSNELVIKMDGDGQHPTGMLETVLGSWNKNIDCIVCSRYVNGGNVIWSRGRDITSHTAKLIAYVFLKDARKLGDPLSGYLMARRSLVTHLEPYDSSYKILLQILGANQNVRIVEIPFIMTDRKKGGRVEDSKSPFSVHD